MAVSAGTAALQVVPTLAKTFSRDLTTQLAGPAVRTANKAGTDAGRTFGKRFGDSTERASGDAGKRSGLRFSTGLRTGIGPIRGIMRGFGPALAGAFGATALVAGIKSVTDEAREAAVVGRLTEARLRSTGGVANVTAKQVEGLATRLSNLSGVDDDLIQSSQNLLLTFTGIRNEAGKGNDIFNQSSAAILDMTAQMNNGQITANGLKASTIQVGKALNDPIKGMTALSKVGVTFNQQQKDQIKTLVESGDKLGAQKIILAELRKEFGGSAAASADAGKRFGVFIGNLKERIGGVLLPILNRFLEFLVEKLPGALAGLGRVLRPVVIGVQVFFKALADPDVTTTGAFGVIEKISSGLRGLFDLLVRGDFTRAFASIFNVAEDSPLVATLLRIREGFISLKRFLPAVAAGLSALLVASTVAKALNAVGLAIRAIGIAVAANPLGLLALAAVAVGAALLFFFRKTEAGQKVLQTLWNLVKGLAQVFFTQVIPAVTAAVEAFVRGLMPGLGSLGHVLKTQVLPALKVVAIIIGVTLYAALKYVLPLLLRIAGPVLGFFFKQLGQTIQWISNVIRFIGRLGAWLARWIAGTKTTGAAVAELGRRVGVFAANMAKQWQGITRSVGDALSFLRRTTVTVLSAMIRFWLRWAGNIVDAAATALGWMPGLGPKLKTAQAKFHAFADSVNKALDNIQDEGVTVKIKGTFTPPPGFSMHSIVGAQKGYRIPGYGGGDRVPIMAEAGETVVSKEHSRLGFMRDAFAAAGVPGFRRGGGVDVNLLTPQVGAFGGRISNMVEALSEQYGATLAKNLRVVVSAGKEAVTRFVRSLDPLPYIWGGAGPGGYDCSGAVGAVQLAHMGRPYGHGQRLYTTGSIRAGVGGLKSGLGGVLDIGVTAGTGHMAGRYGGRNGLGFEAESTATGIKVGAAASRPESFARHYHLAKGGQVIARKVDDLARAGILDVGGDQDRLRINGRVFDRGGTLDPGFNLVANRTGRPEPLVPAGRGSAIDYDRLGAAVARALASQPIRASVEPHQARAGIRDSQRHSGVPKREQLR